MEAVSAGLARSFFPGQIVQSDASCAYDCCEARIYTESFVPLPVRRLWVRPLVLICLNPDWPSMTKEEAEDKEESKFVDCEVIRDSIG